MPLRHAMALDSPNMLGQPVAMKDRRPAHRPARNLELAQIAGVSLTAGRPRPNTFSKRFSCPKARSFDTAH